MCYYSGATVFVALDILYKGVFMRLDKYLSNSGLGSRREIKQKAKAGLIKVNSAVVKDPAVHINENSDEVFVDGVKVVYTKYVYLMLNKPSGYVSATYDKKLPTVAQLIPDEYTHFEPFPVGRLDIDTHGLLIMTNDGDMCHRLLSPKNHIDKKYYVESDIPLTDEDIKTLEDGVILEDGYKTMPCIVEKLEDNKSYITIQEGKFHQVKRMYEAVGKKVVYLKRISMGSLLLDPNLKEGCIRPLTDDELKLLNCQEER